MLLRQYLSISVVPHMRYINISVAHRLAASSPVEAGCSWQVKGAIGRDSVQLTLCSELVVHHSCILKVQVIVLLVHLVNVGIVNWDVGRHCSREGRIQPTSDACFIGSYSPYSI
jgi:hypothetical protein